MSDARSKPGNPDDPEIPFIFVPHGDPEPVEWMARHPGWMKIPATLVPREAPAPARPARTPHTPTPHPSWWNNPVGTEGPLFYAENASPPGKLDDVVGEWPTGKPMLRSEYEAIRNYSTSLFSSLAMIEAVGRDVAAIPPENRAFSMYVGSNPPSKPQRPIAADYPNGVPSDATGRITADIEGRPLTAQNIAGRRTVDDTGEGRDWGLVPPAIKSVGADAGGARFLDAPASQLPGKAVGTFVKGRDHAADSRLLFTDSEGRPLVAQTIVGRNYAGQAEAPFSSDWGSIESTGRSAFGVAPQAFNASDLPCSSSGVTVVSRGSGASSVSPNMSSIRFLKNLPPGQRLVDWRGRREG